MVVVRRLPLAVAASNVTSVSNLSPEAPERPLFELVHEATINFEARPPSRPKHESPFPHTPSQPWYLLSPYAPSSGRTMPEEVFATSATLLEGDLESDAELGGHLDEALDAHEPGAVVGPIARRNLDVEV